LKSLDASIFTDATITSLTASRALVTDGSKKLMSSTTTAVEVGYLSGVTSLIQTQINNKQSTSEKGQANGYAPLDSSGFLPGAYSEALTGDITSAAGSTVTAISAGVIVDADVNSSAAIGWTKISKTGSSLADLVTRSAGDLSSGTLLAARMPALSGDITMTAGTTTTAIAAGVIVNADINASAQIDATKIGTAGITNTEFGYLDGLTSNIQAQLNAKTGMLYVGATAPSDTTMLWQKV